MSASTISKIKWQQKDYVTLGKAVANFNKKINELNKEEKKLYLPDTITYKEVKENIVTRNELNRVIKSLKRFSNPRSRRYIYNKSRGTNDKLGTSRITVFSQELQKIV